jgi:hypothetical protein
MRRRVCNLNASWKSAAAASCSVIASAAKQSSLPPRRDSGLLPPSLKLRGQVAALAMTMWRECGPHSPPHTPDAAQRLCSVSRTRGGNVRVRLILAAPWRRAETGHSCEPLNLKLWIVLPAGVSWYARPCPPGHDCAVHATPATDLTIISVRSHRRRFLATPEHE